MSDLIERQAAIDALGERPIVWTDDNQYALGERNQYDIDRLAIETLPSAQPERDVPIKPNETTDKAWGIPSRQAVCPKCGYYLGHIAFLDGYKGKRITYCETCGQAIDWEGWNFDE